jgi:hypothetical protein
LVAVFAEQLFEFQLARRRLFLGYYIYRNPDKKEPIKVLSLIILLSWIFGAVYQLIKLMPMPMPEYLSWIGLVLLGVACLNAVIFLVPVISLVKNK